MWVFINDQFVEQEKACVSVFDHGFLYGDGVYETLRIYDGRIFLLDDHLARLRRSCDRIGLVLSMTDGQWIPILSELLRRNDLKNGGIRVTISRGTGELGVDPSLCARPTIVAMSKSGVRYPDYMRKDGVRIESVSIRRNPESAQSPSIKSLSFLNNILAKQEALQAGAFDALMLNIDGHVTECTTSNFFFVKGQQVHTPASMCGILEGITRRVVIELAGDLEIPVHEGCYSIEQVLQAEECFMTNTGMEIMPVSQIGVHTIGQGMCGPITTQLWETFQRKIDEYLGPNLLEGT